jgi:hypothetical protein
MDGFKMAVFKQAVFKKRRLQKSPAGNLEKTP